MIGPRVRIRSRRLVPVVACLLVLPVFVPGLGGIAASGISASNDSTVQSGDDPLKPAPRRVLVAQAPGAKQDLASFKMLVDRLNWGDPKEYGDVKVEVALLRQRVPETFKCPEKLTTKDYHFHRALEIYYVLEGTLVNTYMLPGKETGVPYEYNKGDICVIHPGTHVNHQASQEVTAVIIWVPGGEADRLATVVPGQQFFKYYDINDKSIDVPKLPDWNSEKPK